MLSKINLQRIIKLIYVNNKVNLCSFFVVLLQSACAVCLHLRFPVQGLSGVVHTTFPILTCQHFSQLCTPPPPYLLDVKPAYYNCRHQSTPYTLCLSTSTFSFWMDCLLPHQVIAHHTGNLAQKQQLLIKSYSCILTKSSKSSPLFVTSQMTDMYIKLKSILDTEYVM